MWKPAALPPVACGRGFAVFGNALCPVFGALKFISLGFGVILDWVLFVGREGHACCSIYVRMRSMTSLMCQQLPVRGACIPRYMCFTKERNGRTVNTSLGICNSYVHSLLG